MLLWKNIDQDNLFSLIYDEMTKIFCEKSLEMIHAWHITCSCNQSGPLIVHMRTAQSPMLCFSKKHMFLFFFSIG